jgi:hypothetical protein
MRKNHAPRGRRMFLASLLCTTACMSGILCADSGNQPNESAGQQELLLVRAWNPETGELLGWMPFHRVAITLQRLGEGTPGFDLNEALTVDFPYRPKASAKYAAAHVAAETANFQGRQWIPAESIPNIVYVRHIPFYVKVIDFGESNGQRPGPIGQTQPK